MKDAIRARLPLLIALLIGVLAVAVAFLFDLIWFLAIGTVIILVTVVGLIRFDRHTGRSRR